MQLFGREFFTHYIACSECFRDIGLRKSAERFGNFDTKICKQCKSKSGAKLSETDLNNVCDEFFVRGTRFIGYGSLASQLMYNQSDRSHDEFGSPDLRYDLELLAQNFDRKVFFYGPPMWMFGKDSDEDGVQRWNEEDFDYLCNSFPDRIISNDEIFYRIQTNVSDNLTSKRFCSPPEEFRKEKEFGRFDSEILPVLYASFDLETCLHESRVAIIDEIYLASLSAKETLKIKDFSKPSFTDPESPFEDPGNWLRCLLFDSASYETCRELAKYLASRGYDGFISTSFFQQVSRKKFTNISIFGAPIVEGKIEVKGINRIVLQDVSFQIAWGPAISISESS